MTEHDHLKNLTNLGFIVDEKVRDSIANLNEEQFFKLIESLKKSNAFIVNESVLKAVTTEDVKILRAANKVDAFTIQDFVRLLNEKYSFLQSLLIKKLEMSSIVSINKCSSGSATVIGMVKEKEANDRELVLCLEDPTGEIQVVMPKKLGEKINLDDVIAASGRIDNKTMVADKVMFPDIPLKPVIFSEEPVAVAFSDNEVKTDYQIKNGKLVDNIKIKEQPLANPCIFRVGSVIILLLSGFDPLDVLRKRYVKVNNSDFLIDPLPDIVFTDNDVNTNYKGISIVSKDKIIDLRTREVQVI